MEKQGRRKAQFIAEAVLHYINFPESPEIKAQWDQVALKKNVESIVKDFLQKELNEPDVNSQLENHAALLTPSESENATVNYGDIDPDLFASIQNSIKELRNRR
ncbi:MAG: hypothetical protein LBI03_08445 [Clostridiales bacterium]|nr:hypothetical protein [Clostridiales bacterium]